MKDVVEDPGLERCLRAVAPGVRAVLEGVLEDRELSVEGALVLCGASGRELLALGLVADAMRARQVGDRVTYVVNRNINFTNVCVKACGFCAFSRTRRSEEGYWLDEDEIVRRVLEARAVGATEVCLQAGLAPGMDGWTYVRLCQAVKRAAPEVHVHAFSPEEVKYGAGLAGVSFGRYLEELKGAGLGSLPGTSAEILDDGVRARIAKGRITTAEWIAVVRAAHALGLPTTATMMYGHVETDAERVGHLALLRTIQRETGGFTEFVPLSFVHDEAPMWREARVPGLRAGPTGNEVLRVYAIARLMLGRHVANLQVAWVKEGLRFGQLMLACGANDLGGTLINESISTAAGSGHGQRVTPSVLRAVARDAGRSVAQRDTRYRVLRDFGPTRVEGEDAGDPLEAVTDPEARFGSYAALTQDARWRFRLPQVAPR